MTTQKSKSRQQTSRLAYEYLREHPDEMFHYSAIYRDTGSPGTLESVGAALGALVSNPQTRIVRPQRGYYMYSSAHPAMEREPIAAEEKVPNASPKETSAEQSKIYEYVGRITPTLDMIRDDHSNLYVAMPVAAYLEAAGSLGS